MKTRIFSWLLNHLDKFSNRLVRELAESRSMLNWVYCTCYLALVWYCVITNPSSMNTAIVTTGTLVGAIFTSYVFGQSYEKVVRIRTNGAQPKPETGDESD